MGAVEWLEESLLFLAMRIFWRDCTLRAAVAALTGWPYSMSMVAMSVKSLRGTFIYVASEINGHFYSIRWQLLGFLALYLYLHMHDAVCCVASRHHKA